MAVNSRTLSALLLIAFCRYCKLSFIGVSGFLISCATCRAISRQAPSRSLLARATALSSSFATILLYSFTSSPISSSRFQSIASFICPRLTAFIFLLMKEKERVMRLVMNRATIPAIRKMNAFRLMMVTRKLAISSCSLLSEVKYGIFR